jgi:hypothetical protein
VVSARLVFREHAPISGRLASCVRWQLAIASKSQANGERILTQIFTEFLEFPLVCAAPSPSYTRRIFPQRPFSAHLSFSPSLSFSSSLPRAPCLAATGTLLFSVSPSQPFLGFRLISHPAHPAPFPPILIPTSSLSSSSLPWQNSLRPLLRFIVNSFASVPVPIFVNSP